MKVKMNLPTASEIIRRKGLGGDGDIQRFHTQNVLRRIVKYLPYRSGATVKLTIAQTDVSKPEIVTETPYAKYLYFGVVMEGRAPKKATDRPLQYTKTKNPLAGPFWDRALVANEGDVLVEELQRFIDTRR